MNARTDYSRLSIVENARSGLLVGFAVIFAFGVIGRRHLLVFPPFLLTAGILTTGGFIAAAWEITEYTSDHLLGTRAQNASLEDTMTDIIFGVAGATAVAITMSIHHRGHRLPLVDSLLRDRDLYSVAPATQDTRVPTETPPVTGADED
ncbi:hypothetical protein DQ353_20805 [Arthrobacter sp. AQ5-05]|uniref:hypothetical protein n=1 Tax=Arthrobacter sp. AQ5-05 TaxID=2184581 RepID=UPI000DCB68C3|nr:hypothetical protein [Arthrobacter sp. AQ5-05]RAX45953.1 hypothetical protein DQ353_20805 [Arthrobacter sp. AQ5-05]